MFTVRDLSSWKSDFSLIIFWDPWNKPQSQPNNGTCRVTRVCAFIHVFPRLEKSLPTRLLPNAPLSPMQRRAAQPLESIKITLLDCKHNLCNKRRDNRIWIKWDSLCIYIYIYIYIYICKLIIRDLINNARRNEKVEISRSSLGEELDHTR